MSELKIGQLFKLPFVDGAEGWRLLHEILPRVHPHSAFAAPATPGRSTNSDVTEAWLSALAIFFPEVCGAPRLGPTSRIAAKALASILVPTHGTRPT